MTDPVAGLDRLLRMARLLEERALGELRRRRQKLSGVAAEIAALSAADGTEGALLAPAPRAAWEAWRTRRRAELERMHRDLARGVAQAEADARLALGRRVALERMLRDMQADRRARKVRRQDEGLSLPRIGPG